MGKKIKIMGKEYEQDQLIKGAVIVGGVLVVGAGLYYLTSSNTSSGTETKKTTKGPSKSRFTVILKDRFDGINVCPDADFNNCFISSDPESLKKNSKLKVGAQLIKFNNEKCAGWTFEETLKKISAARTPITAQFLEHPELESKWQQAEKLKIQANELNKKKNDLQRYDKALALYSQAIELHPTRKEYYGNRVLMYFGKKRFAEALKDCETFKPYDPLGRWQRGFHLRGLVYTYLERNQEALKEFKQVVAIDPSSKMAEKARTRINQLN